MKTYRPAAELLAEAEQLLGAKYSPEAHPLQSVLMLLLNGRNYSRLELELELEGTETAAPPSRSDIRSQWVAPVNIGSHEYGRLRALVDREDAFSAEDRRLLKQAANLLARFLATNGRYILFRARQVVAASPQSSREAAAGDNRRG